MVLRIIVIDRPQFYFEYGNSDLLSLFSFQSFLSIDCRKTAHMILTEFPDTLTIVIRQLEVRARLVFRTSLRKCRQIKLTKESGLCNEQLKIRQWRTWKPGQKSGRGSTG